MSSSTSVPTAGPRADAPITLDDAPPRTLGLRDALGLWGNLGISLLLPVAATFVVLPGRPLGVTLLAIVVGALIGAVLLGLGAAAGAREGVPGMVLLRGLLGRHASALPTVLNLVQCVGWATFEIVIIGRAAFTGAAVGYGLATVVMFTLGVFALVAYGSAGLDVIDALLAVPLGLLA